MSGIAFDGFYTPAPTDIPRDSRWPWVVMAAGLAIVVSGAVALSGGAASDDRGGGWLQPTQDSSASNP
jgi:hypothetical protein